MRRAREGRAFYASLPLAGVGMQSRMAGTAVAGRLRAKTGTLGAVSSLSGYVTTAGGEELAFALIVNSARSVDAARVVQDSIAVRLAAWVRPSADAQRLSAP
jgi:D-alanyl-D-alanine carboxypeptidase/D-alanyl-D-alanine-endopeptidase (penicillin-binding protein 4)